MLHLSFAPRVRTARKLSFVLAVGGLVAACSAQPSPWLASGRVAPNPIASENPSRFTAKADKGPGAALIARAYADPSNPALAVKAARVLRSDGKRREALALLEAGLASHPGNGVLAREAGLLSLEQGQTAKSEPLLRTALKANDADWHTHSALGVALTSAGKHQEAQRQFAKALTLAPDHPSILNNLALSYALDGKPAKAERILRIVVAAKHSPSQARQNLALVLGAEGKLAEAQGLAKKSALPPTQAASNAEYLKTLADRASATHAVRATEARQASFTPPYALGAMSGK